MTLASPSDDSPVSWGDLRRIIKATTKYANELTVLASMVSKYDDETFEAQKEVTDQAGLELERLVGPLPGISAND